MGSVTINLPESVERQIKQSNVDLNKLISKLISDLSQEEEIIDWSVKLQKSSRKNRFEELKNKGLV